TTTTLPAPPVLTVGPAAGASEWSLLAVGDVLMDDTEAAGVDPFAAVAPPLASAALAVANAEMAIAAGGVAVDKTYTFRAPPSAATRLAAAGIDIANLANNHSLDFGVDALLETIGHLRSNGVATVGAGRNADEAFAPALATVGGVRVAVLGTSRVVPRRGWAAGDGPGIASAFLERRLLAAVRAARAGADVVIVAVHWGLEGHACPEPDQERLGAALLDAGASVVLGSHPHVLQPIVADGRSVLAHSLGNFVFHRRQGAMGESGVLEVRFAGAQVVGHRLHPHVLDHGPPRPAGPESAARIAAAIANSCLPPPPHDVSSR
ncbi:MAG: CapA family protein, partial [Nocardioidaceae bacterium]